MQTPPKIPKEFWDVLGMGDVLTQQSTLRQRSPKKRTLRQAVQETGPYCWIAATMQVLLQYHPFYVAVLQAARTDNLADVVKQAYGPRTLASKKLKRTTPDLFQFLQTIFPLESITLHTKHRFYSENDSSARELYEFLWTELMSAKGILGAVVELRSEETGHAFAVIGNETGLALHNWARTHRTPQDIQTHINTLFRKFGRRAQIHLFRDADANVARTLFS